jgi:hypothetical protein
LSSHERTVGEVAEETSSRLATGDTNSAIRLAFRFPERHGNSARRLAGESQASGQHQRAVNDSIFD